MMTNHMTPQKTNMALIPRIASYKIPFYASSSALVASTGLTLASLAHTSTVRKENQKLLKENQCLSSRNEVMMTDAFYYRDVNRALQNHKEQTQKTAPMIGFLFGALTVTSTIATYFLASPR